MREKAGDFVRNFAMTLNQLLDYPILNSKLLALQLICLMKRVGPDTYLRNVNKFIQTLENCCVFDNDFHFYELRATSSRGTFPPGGDYSGDHILARVRREIKEYL